MLSWFADAESLWRLDQQLVRDVNVNLHQTWLDPIFFVISSTGLGWVQVILILCFFPWGKLFGRSIISTPQPPSSLTNQSEEWGSEGMLQAPAPLTNQGEEGGSDIAPSPALGEERDHEGAGTEEGVDSEGQIISHPQPPPSLTNQSEGWGSESIPQPPAPLTNQSGGWGSEGTSPPNPLSSASRPDEPGFRKLNSRGGIVGLLYAEHVHITVPLLISWAVTGIVDTLIKHDVPRERPSNLAWSLPQESIYANSFASGHTATSFGLAFTVLFLTWNSPKRKWGILALVWACLVGFSRVYRGVHWPSDVVSGFFVGLGCAAALMVVYPERFKARGVGIED